MKYSVKKYYRERGNINSIFTFEDYVSAKQCYDNIILNSNKEGKAIYEIDDDDEHLIESEIIKINDI